uniref:10 kDa phosphoprotein of photosystem II n=1 Tax=Karlodinium veneficum TaxID=407301 RepID=G1E766_KARVE|nr:10 KDa phosphoprotein of photosystem II [Karlodinium veneficum]
MTTTLISSQVKVSVNKNFPWKKQNINKLSFLDPQRYKPNPQLSQLLEPLNKRKANHVIVDWGTIPLMVIVMISFLFFLIIIILIYNGALLYENIPVTW